MAGAERCGEQLLGVRPFAAPPVVLRGVGSAAGVEGELVSSVEAVVVEPGVFRGGGGGGVAMQERGRWTGRGSRSRPVFVSLKSLTKFSWIATGLPPACESGDILPADQRSTKPRPRRPRNRKPRRRPAPPRSAPPAATTGRRTCAWPCARRGRLRARRSPRASWRRAMRIGSLASAMAVFISTASQPSSMASAASEAVPTPASTSTGTLGLLDDQADVDAVLDAAAPSRSARRPA